MLIKLVWFLLIGLAAGWLAGKVMKGRSHGLVGDTVVGSIGAVLGGFLFGSIGLFAGGPVGSLIMAVIGAVLLLYVMRWIEKS